MIKAYLSTNLYNSPPNNRVSLSQVNHHDHDVHVGQTNNDEMCNFYVMYWVKGKDVVDKRVCFSPGPPFWSWKGSAMLPNIPDEAASTIP